MRLRAGVPDKIIDQVIDPNRQGYPGGRAVTAAAKFFRGGGCRVSGTTRERDFFMCENGNRIALVGIIVEDMEASSAVNSVLHDYSDIMVGRMGIPYRKESVGIISVVLDAPADRISALSGKLGMIPGISVKTMYSKQPAVRK